MKTYQKFTLPALAAMMMLSPAFYQESSASLKRVEISRAPAQEQVDSTYVNVKVQLEKKDGDPENIIIQKQDKEETDKVVEGEEIRERIEPLEIKPIGIKPLEVKIDAPKLELKELPKVKVVDNEEVTREKIEPLKIEPIGIKPLEVEIPKVELMPIPQKIEVVDADKKDEEKREKLEPLKIEPIGIKPLEVKIDPPKLELKELPKANVEIAKTEKDEEKDPKAEEEKLEKEEVAKKDNKEKEEKPSHKTSYEELTGLVCHQQNQIERMTSSIDTLVESMNTQMQMMQMMTQLMMMQQMASASTPTYQPSLFGNSAMDGFQAFMFGQRMGSLMNIFSPTSSFNGFGLNSQSQAPQGPVYNYNVTGDFYGRDYSYQAPMQNLPMPQMSNGQGQLQTLSSGLNLNDTSAMNIMTQTPNVNWLNDSQRMMPSNSPMITTQTL